MCLSRSSQAAQADVRVQALDLAQPVGLQPQGSESRELVEVLYLRVERRVLIKAEVAATAMLVSSSMAVVPQPTRSPTALTLSQPLKCR
jgi:hypothetical protein